MSERPLPSQSGRPVIRRNECPVHGATLLFRCPADADLPAEERCSECSECGAEPVTVTYAPFEETYVEAFNAGRAQGYQDGIKTAMERLT